MNKMEKTSRILVLITFILGTIAILAFSFGLIPEETLAQIQEHLNINLEQYLNMDTAVTAGSLALTSGAGLMFKSFVSKNANLTNISIESVKNKSTAELNQVQKQYNNSLEELKKKSEEEIRIKNEEIEILKKQTELAQLQYEEEKKKVKTVSVKKYW